MNKKELNEQTEKKIELCEECGVYPADYPSKLCCGCNDYKDHQC